MKNQILTDILIAWLWPIEFWMRPLTVMDRLKENESLEFFLAIVGGGVWGALMGIVLWLFNGDIHSILITAVAVTVAVAYILFIFFVLIIRIPIEQISIWGIVLAFSFGIGIISVFFC